MKCAIIPTGRRAAALYPPTTSSPTASAAGYAVGQAGQRHEAGLGLYDYHARYYDPLIGRFISADTIVPSPGDPQSLNRYAYVQNNPLKYTDPTGYFANEVIQRTLGVNSWDEVLSLFKEGGILELNWAWLDILHQASDGDIIRGYATLEGGAIPTPVGGIVYRGPPESYFIREGFFRMSEDDKIYIDITSSNCVNFYGNEDVSITAFALGIENSYELFARYEYYGKSYSQRTPYAAGSQWIQRGRAWGGYSRWTADVDWAGLGLDAVGFVGDAWSPALAIGWAATGLDVARYQPDLRAGDKGAQRDLALDVVGTAPGPIGMGANVASLYFALGLRDKATHGRR